MTTVDLIDFFRGRGLLVLEHRHGARVQCPAHDDARPSLDITSGRDGRTLVLCRSGCRVEDVLAAVGLRLGDLFAQPLHAPVRVRPRTVLDAMRAEALAIARRQAWTRHRVRYAAADAIRGADRLRRAAREDDPEVWERLAEAAALTTAAENVLADEA